MPSKQKRKIARQNGAKSVGSKTQQGIQTSAMNALRHGLTGQVTTMTPEDREAHEKFSQAIIQSLEPHGALEIDLAQRIATDSWRLNRASAIEDNLFAVGLHQNAGQLCPDDEQPCLKVNIPGMGSGN